MLRRISSERGHKNTHLKCVFLRPHCLAVVAVIAMESVHPLHSPFYLDVCEKAGFVYLDQNNGYCKVLHPNRGHPFAALRASIDIVNIYYTILNRTAVTA